MTFSLRFVAALAAAFLAGACVDNSHSLSAAASPTDPTLHTVSELGFIGTWAEDCAAGPRPDNWFETYYVTSGRLRRKGDRGPGEAPLDGAVDSAERLGPALVRLRLRNDHPNWGEANGEWYDVTIEVGPDFHRSIDSIGSDGRVYMKDRRFTSNGSPTPFLRRCR